MKEKLKTNRNVGIFALLATVNVLCSGYLIKNIFHAIGSFKMVMAVLSGDTGMIAKIMMGGTMGTILSLASFAIGIYMIVLFWGVCEDVNTICAEYEGENSPQKSPNYILVLLFSVFTLNIYYVYWAYKQGNRLWEASHNHYHTDTKDKGSTYLILTLLGYFTGNICRFIFLGKLLCNVNQLAEAYNESIDGKEYPVSSITQDVEDSLTIPMQDWNGKMQEGRMECCAGIYQGAVFPINSSEMMIGRDESRANIIIKNEKVSRVHCGVCYDASLGYYLVTDYSTNGTFYKNGQKLERGMQTSCSPGTILVIAESGNEFLLK